MTSLTVQNQTDSKEYCENHDDNRTKAIISCSKCGYLCAECDKYLHLRCDSFIFLPLHAYPFHPSYVQCTVHCTYLFLRKRKLLIKMNHKSYSTVSKNICSKKSKSHQRQLFKAAEASLVLIKHENMCRAKLYWLMCVVDTQSSKAVIEFRNTYSTHSPDSLVCRYVTKKLATFSPNTVTSCFMLQFMKCIFYLHSRIYRYLLKVCPSWYSSNSLYDECILCPRSLNNILATFLYTHFK